MTAKRFTLEWYAKKYQELTDENEQLKAKIKREIGHNQRLHQDNVELHEENEQLKKENKRLHECINEIYTIARLEEV